MTATRTKPPLGIRLVFGLRKEPDWGTLPLDELYALRDAQNRAAAAGRLRAVTGFPDRGADIADDRLVLPGRELPVRVYRPRTAPKGRLPLVLHVHGGGFIGTAAQCDWVSSHVAARVPAVVVSVDHRLLTPDLPMSAAVDDGWDALRHVVQHASDRGVDPERVAVFGESAGGLIAAMAAIRARDARLSLRAQVLVNPCTDLTATAFDYASMIEHGDSPTLNMPRLELLRRFAVPEGADARAVSPLHADDLAGLAPALVVVPVLDPVADHGRAYAERLRAAGTAAELSEHQGAGHAFLNMSGLVRQARDARARITAFLTERLA
ncbi:alpha/beta hydrolase fold domain-containing protein [Glycomyces harbinensis]|uniref:Acetyl esterase n=1 Tax=Glycomyces harbinensis TaxID=58114 RepID=A0A1G6QXC2_9ACTN|nr:alpha/beta hydrolase [Glycomyces harbinensis]SDC96931.1 acetyl esterase [Glycomyces harbinensis]